MKTKIILGLATMAALALPAMAADGYRYRDGDRRGSYEERYQYGNSYYGAQNGDGDYRTYDRDVWRRREHEERERRERIEHERHEWREHHDGFYR